MPSEQRRMAMREASAIVLIAATPSTITPADCDEVFNYWEPTHYLQYGWGLQTWEYSPVYAIRSWSYVQMHAWAGMILETFVTSNKLQIFILIRSLLGAACAYSEASLYSSVADHLSPEIGWYLLLILLASTGMFISSTAFLPSSFAMYLATLAFARSFHRPSRTRTLSVLLILATGTIFGWPFCGALALPFLVEDVAFNSDTMVVTRVRRVIEAGAIAIIGILVPFACLEYYFYHKWTLVPLNIVLYNVFGGKDRGPDLYGTEPWWFYLFNGVLNFNVAFLAAIASLPLLILLYPLLKSEIKKQLPGSGLVSLTLKLAYMYLWVAIFTMQPHKEERFLFVVYPMIGFAAALSLWLLRETVVQSLSISGVTKSAAPRTARLLVRLFLLLFVALSVSRTAALYYYYHAPMTTYIALTEHIAKARQAETLPSTNLTEFQPTTVCVGREWYRFPSHFLLPDATRIRFLKSSFSGLLPKDFVEAPLNPSVVENATIRDIALQWVQQHRDADRPGTYEIPTGMNDLNQEELDRYVPISTCDYVIDSGASGDDSALQHIAEHPDQWEQVHCERFLDVAQTSRLARIFWIPDTVAALLDEHVLHRIKIQIGEKRWVDYCAHQQKRR
ncbi:Alg9-like mannosyltransferase family-domain-containing protein [Polychytrium aggregatum]|uniref:Alg9-like mannosyltransferase family-domain-containing protein n=1 Tax=Polychytrium aggregatum TaxID=110093 RepID=UPI0022FE3E22|nr:Alg9-like mannosyltransferase family-domain-containing protein [Polychytrium aggregatum]KAI9202641.1 Alg9-like mannosyltransferase family-domain-containing protein [Polychytrium aggregatum]